MYPCTTVHAHVSLCNYHPCITTFYYECLCIAMYYCVYTHALLYSMPMYLAIDSEGMGARGIIIVLVLIIQLVGQKNIETKHLSLVN